MGREHQGGIRPHAPAEISQGPAQMADGNLGEGILVQGREHRHLPGIR